MIFHSVSLSAYRRMEAPLRSLNHGASRSSSGSRVSEEISEPIVGSSLRDGSKRPIAAITQAIVEFGCWVDAIGASKPLAWAPWLPRSLESPWVEYRIVCGLPDAPERHNGKRTS